MSPLLYRLSYPAAQNEKGRDVDRERFPMDAAALAREPE
jgi:hypothetical protein